MAMALRRHGHVLLGRRRVRQGVVAAAVRGAASASVGVGSKLLAHLAAAGMIMMGVVHHVLLVLVLRRHSLDAPQDGHVARARRLDPPRGMLLRQLEGRGPAVRRQEAGGHRIVGVVLGMMVVVGIAAAAGVFGHERGVAVVRRGDAAEGHRRQGRRILVRFLQVAHLYLWPDLEVKFGGLE